MIRLILSYGAALAALALLSEWMGLRRQVGDWSTSFYVLCIAILFAALGVWLGNRLAPRPRGPYRRNEAALASLAISPRELQVLDLLAEGFSNKAIARRLNVSPNTVKTHLARLFEKLEAQSRTQAVAKARSLDLVP